MSECFFFQIYIFEKYIDATDKEIAFISTEQLF